MTFTEFQDSFELQARALLVPEDAWSRLIPLYVIEGALVIFKNLVEKQPYLADDYPALMRQLAKEFQNSGVASSVDLYSCKKSASESVGKFYASVTSLAKRLYPDMQTHARDQIILGAFIHGLPVAYQRQLLNNQQINTSEAAFKLAQRYERTNEVLQKENSSAAVNHVVGRPNHESTSADQQFESIRRSLKNLEQRERERAEGEDRIARHYQRESNMKRRPIGPNRFWYNPPQRRMGRKPHWRQNWDRNSNQSHFQPQQTDRNWQQESWRPDYERREGYNNYPPQQGPYSHDRSSQSQYNDYNQQGGYHWSPQAPSYEFIGWCLG